jgi:hypothetical protein
VLCLVGEIKRDQHKATAIIDNTKIQDAKITQQTSGDTENHKIPASRTGTGDNKGNLAIAESVYKDKLEEDTVSGGIKEYLKRKGIGQVRDCEELTTQEEISV